MTSIEEGVSDHESPNDEAANNNSSFTLIQSRRLLGQSPLDISIELCPSMDIMWLQNSLYRTLGTSTPRLAIVPHEPDTLRIPPAWRPDGRWIASSPEGTSVQLHSLETLISVPSSSDALLIGDATGGVVSFTPRRDVSIDDKVNAPTAITPLRMLKWAQVSKGHRQWQQVDTTTWVGQNYLLPVQPPKLPPSEYHNIPTELPTLQSPLNALVVLLQDGTLDLFLHGRYPVLSNYQMIPPTDAKDKALQMCVSPDLTHIMCATSQRLNIASWPRLGWHRQYWQHMTVLYTSLQHHLQQIELGQPSIKASYKTTLLPLDRKLEGLVTLLQRYQVCEKLQNNPAALLRYALVQSMQAGYVPRYEDLDNALDQYFTSVAMNDQLMQRLERSLQAVVASVETKINQQLLAPSQALVYHAKTLLGHYRAHPILCGEQSATRLFELCQILEITVTALHQHWVDARWRWQDLVSWLRATASARKARGTAPNSVQREQAFKKRLNNGTWQRMQSYLTTKVYRVADDSVSLTERVLGLQLSEWFVDDTSSNIVLSPLDTNKSCKKPKTEFPPLLLVTKKINMALDQFLQHPRTILERDHTCLSLDFGSLGQLASITTRLGRGSMEDTSLYGREDPSGYFDCAKTTDQLVKQWVVCALVGPDANGINLCAVPLPWIDSADDNDEIESDDESDETSIPMYFYQLALTLPQDALITDLSFYNDDGKSSLSPDSGQEGSRQALTLTVKRDGNIQLWQITYDNARDYWTKQTWKKQDATTRTMEFSTDKTSSIKVVPDNDNHDHGDAIFAKWRSITLVAHTSGNVSNRLIVSGSRGTGAILTQTKDKGICLDLLDLEEDEGDDDNDDDESEGALSQDIEDMNISQSMDVE